MHAANSRQVTHGPRPASPECSGHKLMLWDGFGIPDRRHVYARMCPLEYTKAAALTNNLLEIDGTWRHQESGRLNRLIPFWEYQLRCCACSLTCLESEAAKHYSSTLSVLALVSKIRSCCKKWVATLH